jgi:hypothetical protein
MTLHRSTNFALRLIILTVIIASPCLGGCSREAAPKKEPPAQSVDGRGEIKKLLTQQEIEAVAITETLKRTSRKADELGADSYRAGANWHVTVTRYPEMPGGFTEFTLSETGDIKEVVGGE